MATSFRSTRVTSGSRPEAVAVSLVEWAVEAPTEYAAGDVTFSATNNGNFPHEFVVIQGEGYESLPLAEGGAVIEDELPTGALARADRAHRRRLDRRADRHSRTGELRPAVQPGRRRQQPRRPGAAPRHHGLVSGPRHESRLPASFGACSLECSTSSSGCRRIRSLCTPPSCSSRSPQSLRSSSPSGATGGPVSVG